MTIGHAPFAPSSLFRTVRCTGWRKESEGIEEVETDESREGTAVHHIAQCILVALANLRDPLHADHFVGKDAPNGVVMTEDMFDCADFYVKYVSTFVSHWPNCSVEVQLDIPEVHDDCWGTPDLFFGDQDNTLHVFDYKNGHRRVEAFKNEQLMSYAIAACRAIRKIPDNIVLHIVQPNCFDGFGSTRTWSLTYDRLVDEVATISSKCYESEENPTLTPTPEGCRDCPARYKCHALHDAVITPPPIAVREDVSARSVAEIASELKVLTHYLELVKSRRVGLEEEVTALLRGGVAVPGWSLEQRFGHNKWGHPDDEIIAMGTLFGCDLAKLSVVSPAQAVKIFKKNNIDESVISHYYSKEPSGMALVPVDNLKAKMIFGD